MVNGLELLMPIHTSVETRQNIVQSGFKCAVAHILVGIVNEEIFSATSVKIEDMGWHAS